MQTVDDIFTAYAKTFGAHRAELLGFSLQIDLTIGQQEKANERARIETYLNSLGPRRN
jgi:hypothetical protein